VGVGGVMVVAVITREYVLELALLMSKVECYRQNGDLNDDVRTLFLVSSNKNVVRPSVPVGCVEEGRRGGILRGFIPVR
jgi:hypothetical protein